MCTTTESLSGSSLTALPNTSNFLHTSLVVLVGLVSASCTLPRKFLLQGTIASNPKLLKRRSRLLMTSKGWKHGTDVLQPVPMPLQPFTKTMGMTGANTSGSTVQFSSSSIVSTSLSSGLKMRLVTQASLVVMYLALAASFPPLSRVPNMPCGSSRLMLLAPTKFCAMMTIASTSDCSPWWYCVSPAVVLAS